MERKEYSAGAVKLSFWFMNLDVAHQAGIIHGPFTIASANVFNGSVHFILLFPPDRIVENCQLLRTLLRDKADCPDT